MHRDFCRRFLFYSIALGGLLLTGSGCSFVKVPQGWVLNTGWSLEFHRMPFHASCERSCETGCEVGCNPTCNTDCASPTQNSGEPTVAPSPIDPAPTLHRMEEVPSPEAGESAGLLNLLRRRGRLGLCATCGKMGRFNEPQPAEQSTMPVIAKFHPVPSSPVFYPRPTHIVPALPTNFSSPPGKLQPVPSKNLPLPPEPESVPPPPPDPGETKRERPPRELDIPTEPPEWVFAAPEKRSEASSESPSQSKRSSSSSRR